MRIISGTIMETITLKEIEKGELFKFNSTYFIKGDYVREVLDEISEYQEISSDTFDEFDTTRVCINVKTGEVVLIDEWSYVYKINSELKIND